MDDQNAPDTLPADFFDKQSAPDTLPADFFDKAAAPGGITIHTPQQIVAKGAPQTQVAAPPPAKSPVPAALGGKPAPYNPDLSFYENWSRGNYIPDFNWRDQSTWLPAIGKMPLEGGAEVVHGIEQLANPHLQSVGRERPTTTGQNVARGVHQIVSGTGEAIAPVALPAAAIVNPVGTVAALGLGAAGGAAAHKGAEAAGLAPEYADLAGDVGNIAAGAAGSSLASRAVLPKVSLSPTEAAAVQFADENKIPLSTYARTGSEAIRKKQAAVAESKAATRAQTATEAGMRTAAQDIAGAPLEIPEQAGAGVRTALEATEKQHAAAASRHYDDLAQIEAANVKPITTGYEMVDSGLVDQHGQPIIHRNPIVENIGLPADMAPAKNALTPLRDRLMQEMPLAQQQQSRGLQALNNIINGKDYLPASIADRNLSAVKALLRENISDPTKFVVRNALDALDPVVDQAVAQGGPNATAALAEGRALTRAKYATRATLEQLPDEPVMLFNRLASRGDAHINLLRDVQQHAPGSLPAVGRAVLEGLFDTSMGNTGQPNPKAALAAWGKLGDGTKAVLFSPEQVKALDNFFNLGVLESATPRAGTGAIAPPMRSWGQRALDPAAILSEALLWNAGHTKLGGAMAGMQLANLAYKYGSRTMAKLLWDPRIARMLSTPYRVPPSIVGGVAGAAENGLENRAQGGPIADLERQAFDRGHALDYLRR